MASGETLLYGALALGVSEATGVTNFTGASSNGGGSSNAGGGGGGIINIPGLEGIRSGLTDAITAAESAREAARYARLLAGQGNGGGATTVNLPDLPSWATSGSLPPWLQGGDGGGDPTETPGDGDGESEWVTFDSWRGPNAADPGGETSGGTPGSRTGGHTQGFDTQDLANPEQGLQLGDFIATGGEATHQAGQVVNDVTRGVEEFRNGFMKREVDAWKRQFDSTPGGGVLDTGPLFQGPDPFNLGGNGDGSTQDDPADAPSSTSTSSGGGSDLRSAVGPSEQEQRKAAETRQKDGRVLPFGPTVKW